MREISMIHKPLTGMIEAHRRAIEENHLQTVFGCLGIGKMLELRRIAQEAQEARERAKQCSVFGGLSSAAQSGGLKLAQSLGERFRETKTFGGAVPSEEQFQREFERQNSPLGKIWREMREILAREEAEQERRESTDKILRDHHRKLAESFVIKNADSVSLETASIKPIKINFEINVIINPAPAEGTN